LQYTRGFTFIIAIDLMLPSQNTSVHFKPLKRSQNMASSKQYLGLQVKHSITFFRQKVRWNGHGCQRTVKRLEGQDLPSSRCCSPKRHKQPFGWYLVSAAQHNPPTSGAPEEATAWHKEKKCQFETKKKTQKSKIQ